jgi:hypothetical protein
MTSLDDQLRDLFHSASPEAEALQGDVAQVRARLRRRIRRTRLAMGAAAAAVVAVGGLLLTGPGDKDSVVTDDTTTSRPESRSSTTDGTSTTGSSEPAAPPSATTGSTTTTSGTPPPPPTPSIRDVALGEATYAEACAGFGDGRSASLSGGTARLPIGDGAFYVVDLGPVGYADVDGDADDDAVVLLRCTFAGASTDNNVQLRAYRVGSDGQLEQVGPSQLVEHVHEATADGPTVTVTADKYGADDPACCPSAGAREVWRFDDGRFVMIDTTPIPPPGAGA